VGQFLYANGQALDSQGTPDPVECEGLNPAPLRLGLFGIGLDAYWPQFAGLKERLEGHLGAVAARLARPGAEVVNLGLVDNPDRARAAGREFRRADVDLLFLHVTTYALSSTVLPVVQHARVPVIVLNLAPAPAIDYGSFNRMKDRTEMTGHWLAHCSACPVPEIANVFKRAGIRFHQVTGVLTEDAGCWAEVDAWVNAARVVAGMAANRLGLMGHAYSGMLDIESDATLQAITFGTHVEHLEVDELSGLRRGVPRAAVAGRRAQIGDAFDVQPDCGDEELAEAARTSVALDELVARHRLGSLAYYYKGTGVPENEATLASIIVGCSLLTARGVPVAGEYEVKNVQAMKIMDLMGVGGSFTEFYAMDYNDDVVLMGHDGPAHIAIAQGKTKVRPLKLYHGKVGRGLSVEMAVRHGEVTLLSVVEREGGGLALVCAEGESVPGPILEIGNTNSRYRFSCGAREFVQRWNSHGPAHHCAVGVGRVADTLSKVGLLLGLETARVA
jgi:L-arabinose isomerase